jgi:hypothetical protein
VAFGWPRRIEHPCTFGATPAVKMPHFNPYQGAKCCRQGALREV